MKITSIKINKTETPNTKIKGFATVTIDNAIAIHNIRIVDGPKGLFIAMPSKKIETGFYKDFVHPINSEVREYFTTEILNAYKEFLTNNESANIETNKDTNKDTNNEVTSNNITDDVKEETKETKEETTKETTEETKESKPE